MHEILRDRLWRRLEVLPEEQLYQVLDYIEFLESKYAPGRSAPPSALQKFAERLEDGMRLRSVAPQVISGTVGLMGTARKVFDGVSGAGRGIMDVLDTTAKPQQPSNPGGPSSKPKGVNE